MGREFRDMMKDYVGKLNEVAADATGHAIHIDVRAPDDGAQKVGWAAIQPDVAREVLAVALTALSMGGHITVRYDEATNMVNAVRARPYK